MGNYRKWLLDALDMLEKDYRDQLFEPRNESDVKCHLYHTLLSTKARPKILSSHQLVLSEYPELESRKYDLSLCSIGKKERKPVPRLVVEIKETQGIQLDQTNVEAKIRSDIDKLREYVKKLKNERKTVIPYYLRKPTMVFFFRNAPTQGIDQELETSLESLGKKYRDVSIWWGPKPARHKP